MGIFQFSYTSIVFMEKKLCSVANIVVSMVDGGPFCLHIGGPPFEQTFNAFKIAAATACWNEVPPFILGKTFLSNKSFCHLSLLFRNAKHWAIPETGGDGGVLNKTLRRISSSYDFSICYEQLHGKRMEIKQNATCSSCWIDRFLLWQCKWHPKMHFGWNLQSLRCCQVRSNRLQQKRIIDGSALLAGGFSGSILWKKVHPEHCWQKDYS